MNYNYNFSLGAILFGALTLIFFFREKRIRDMQDRLYSLTLICAFVSVVFDSIAAAMEPVAASYPSAVVYFNNIVFLLSMQTCLPSFWQYSLCAAGKMQEYSYKRRAVFCLPYFLMIACLFLSPFCRYGIFYLSETNGYLPGATHFVLYISAGFYMLTSTFILLRNFKIVQKEKRIVILLFSAIVFASMLLQIVFPRYLLTSFACMLAVSAVFYVLQSPLEMREIVTGAYNRMLLPTLLHNYQQQRIGYTLLLFSLRSFDQICAAYGLETSNEVLRRLSEMLQKDFPNDTTVYMDTAEFTVVCPRELPRKELEGIHAARPRYIVTDGGRIPIELSIAAVLHNASESPKAVLTATDYLYNRLRVAQGSELLLADAAFQAECDKQISLESHIEEILQSGTPLLSFEPILRWGRTPWGASAHLCFEHPAAEDVSAQRLFQCCEQGGLAWRYLSLMLTSSAPYGAQFAPNCRLYLPLSPYLCMSSDAPERILDLTSRAGFTPGQIAFYALESRVAAASDTVLENIVQLASLGFAFCLDDFAEGYSDISLLTSLPLYAVRVSPEMFSLAAQDMRQLKLLRGTADILHKLDIMVICGGIDSVDDASVAAAADITLIQGAFVRGAASFPKAPETQQDE